MVLGFVSTDGHTPAESSLNKSFLKALIRNAYAAKGKRVTVGSRTECCSKMVNLHVNITF
jgi:hypothetical protein